MSRVVSSAKWIILRLPMLVLIACGIVLPGCLGYLARSQGAYNIQELPTQPATQAVQEPALYQATCTLCHGGDSMGTDRAPALANSTLLRSLSDSDIAAIIVKGKNKMPAFALPQSDVDQIVHYIRSLNAAPVATAVAGDAKAGESIFFGDGQCSTCHTAAGRGSSYGPDLSSIASRLNPAALQQALTNHGSSAGAGGGGGGRGGGGGFGAAPATYDSVIVTLNDGSELQGLNRAQGSHDLVLQTRDGKLHILSDDQYRSVVPDSTPVMPAYKGTPEQLRNLVAYLATLKVWPLDRWQEHRLPSHRRRSNRICHPKQGDWPNYNGTLDNAGTAA